MNEFEAAAADAKIPVVFVAGGKVQASGGTYVERAADQQLYELCKQSKPAYVLLTRQVGKTSLITNVAGKLRASGVVAAVVDLPKMGAGTTSEAWHLGVLTEVLEATELDFELFDWWDAQPRLSHTYRMFRFFKDVLVDRISSRIVIFIDEIDNAISLGVTDDFFAGLRELYQARSERPELWRLSFVIVGSVSANELSKDLTRTPYNIGERIELTDFTLDESLVLGRGLTGSEESARELLRRVLYWTGGHPYLTQTVCARIAEAGGTPKVEDVDRVVGEEFLSLEGDQDRNLRYVSEMLTSGSKPEWRQEMYRQYRRILSGRTVLDELQSPELSHLKLCGIVVAEQSKLRVRNRIYQTVFNAAWVGARLTITLRVVLNTAVTLILALSLPLGVTATFFWRDAEASKQELQQALGNLTEVNQRAADALKEEREAQGRARQLEAEAAAARTAAARAQRELADAKRVADEANMEAEAAQRASRAAKSEAENESRRAQAARRTHARVANELADASQKLADAKENLDKTKLGAAQLEAQLKELQAQRSLLDRFLNQAPARKANNQAEPEP